jgi:hypothetical protein
VGLDEQRPRAADEGPTEMVETDEGELVERLSGGTATLLLVWLIGIGAGSALLAVWILARALFDQRLGLGDLFSGLGLYVSIFGAAGPTVLWLAGRAQGRSLAWFAWTAAKIGLLMIGIMIVFGVVVAWLLGGELGAQAPFVGGVLVAATLLLSIIWALAVWSADRYIARARVGEE